MLKRSRSNSNASLSAPSPKRSSSVEPTSFAKMGGAPYLEQASDMLLDSQIADYSASIAIEPSQSSRPDAATQAQEISRLKKTPLKAGDEWYMISMPWWRRWKVACTPQQERDQKMDPALLRLAIDDLLPIDNTPLIDDNGMLKMLPTEGENVEYVHKNAWLLLLQWYGLKNPPGAIPRKVITYGSSDSTRIEVYPPRIRLRQIVANNVPVDAETRQAPIRTFSTSDSLDVLKAAIRKELGIDESAHFRLWRMPWDKDVAQGVSASWPNEPERRSQRVPASAVKVQDGGNPETSCELVILPADATTLQEAGLDQSEMELGVEVQQDGKWLVQTSESSSYNPTSTPATHPPSAAAPSFGSSSRFFEGMSSIASSSTSENKVNVLQARNVSAGATRRSVSPSIVSLKNRVMGTRSQVRHKGLTGLGNLGNTCFMNSALQCLSNTVELRQYFESPAWEPEINKDNPLGMSGAVAEQFGELIKQMWSGHSSTVSPRAFKTMIGRFRPMFIGWSQQDSQEFLSFLLDGLHEDLNRIYKKPPTTKPEWEGGGDLEMWKMAKDSWDQFKMRNDSVIVDLFQGMYRSTVVCPDCQKVSITFDAFTSLTLPLPAKKWHGYVFVVPSNTSKLRIKLKVSLPQFSSVGALKAVVGQRTGIDPKRLICADVFHCKIYKMLYDGDEVNSITANKEHELRDYINFYELPFDYLQLPERNTRSHADSNVSRDAKEGKVVVPARFVTKKKQGSGEGLVLPAILAFHASEITSYEVVYEALVRHFARLTRKGAEMFETSEEKPLLNGSMHTDSTDEPLTESQDPEANETGSRVDNPGPSIPPKIPLSAEALPNLFKIYVNTLEGRASSTSNRDDAPVLLKDRIAGKHVESSSASRVVPGSFDNQTTVDDDDEELRKLYEDVQESNPNDELPTPVLRTGDHIVCDVPEHVWKTFFGEPADNIGGQKQTVFIDEPTTSETGPLNVEACLTEFSKTEQLDAQNTWYCPRCKDHKEATKQVDLWSLPDILVMHLKRFSASRWGTRDKISDKVDFPLQGLDLTDRVIERKIASHLIQSPEGRQLVDTDSIDNEPLIYDLYAVDNHFGGLGGGHYTAFALNAEDQRWHNYDDSNVTDVPDPQAVVTPAAYLLFYRRRTSRPFGGKTIEIVQTAIDSAPQSATVSDTEMEHEDLPSYHASGLNSSNELTRPYHESSRTLMSEGEDLPDDGQHASQLIEKFRTSTVTSSTLSSSHVSGSSSSSDMGSDKANNADSDLDFAPEDGWDDWSIRQDTSFDGEYDYAPPSLDSTHMVNLEPGLQDKYPEPGWHDLGYARDR